MATHEKAVKPIGEEAFELPMPVVASGQPLWQYGFAELTGHNLERRGKNVVNRLLSEGWRLLHVYTLRYVQWRFWAGPGTTGHKTFLAVAGLASCQSPAPR